jgi:hypothetical protein
MRRPFGASLLVLTLGAAIAAATASAQRPHLFELSQLQGGSVSFRDTTFPAGGSLKAFELSASSWGGPITAADGETVNINVSDSYPVDPALPQSVADFLVQLDHGSELSTVNIYLVTLPELQQICGRGAGGCYDGEQKRLYAPGEDLPNGPSNETILAHEYGHHVASSRFNLPWPAIDWGPKRWATAAGVCERTKQGTAVPGDEGASYLLNPGEAWAETYRLLNYQKTAWPNWAFTPWNVDESFYPDATVLAAAREDVLNPWTTNTVTVLTGRFVAPKPKVTANRPKAKNPQPAKPVKLALWKRTVSVPLDGTVVVRLTRAPIGTTVTLSEPNGTVLGLPAKRVSTTDCGSRSIVATVKATRAGAFSLIVSTP